MPKSKVRKGHRERVRKRKQRLINKRNHKFNEFKKEQEKRIAESMGYELPEEMSQEDMMKEVTRRIIEGDQHLPDQLGPVGPGIRKLINNNNEEEE